MMLEQELLSKYSNQHVESVLEIANTNSFAELAYRLFGDSALFTELDRYSEYLDPLTALPWNSLEPSAIINIVSSEVKQYITELDPYLTSLQNALDNLPELSIEADEDVQDVVKKSLTFVNWSDSLREDIIILDN